MLDRRKAQPWREPKSHCFDVTRQPCLHLIDLRRTERRLTVTRPRLLLGAPHYAVRGSKANCPVSKLLTMTPTLIPASSVVALSITIAVAPVIEFVPVPPISKMLLRDVAMPVR
jgi:hypothetical protein